MQDHRIHAHGRAGKRARRGIPTAAITVAGMSYLLILGSELSPDTADWIRNAAPHATVEVWAGMLGLTHPLTTQGNGADVLSPRRIAEYFAVTIWLHAQIVQF
jgi:hypothetical protein